MYLCFQGKKLDEYWIIKPRHQQTSHRHDKGAISISDFDKITI